MLFEYTLKSTHSEYIYIEDLPMRHSLSLTTSFALLKVHHSLTPVVKRSPSDHNDNLCNLDNLSVISPGCECVKIGERISKNCLIVNLNY